MVDLNSKDFEEKLISVLPSSRQVAFQQTEFYVFVHFTDKEWGDGKESPEFLIR